MSRLMKASVLTAVLFGAGASTATAQTAQGDIQALAQVLTALQVAADDDLDFGLVVQGVAKTVDPSAPAAGTTSGKFTITGQPSQAVSITFTLLPANLTSGGNNLPITYTAVRHTSSTPGGGAAFTPSTGVPNTALNGSGNLYIFLGGTVTPAAGQASGSYSGTVRMEVAYVGY